MAVIETREMALFGRGECAGRRVLACGRCRGGRGGRPKVWVTEIRVVGSERYDTTPPSPHTPLTLPPQTGQVFGVFQVGQVLRGWAGGGG